MRHQYLLAAITVSFLAGAWLGYTQHQPDATPSYALARPEPDTLMTKEPSGQTDAPLPTTLSARMDALHADLRAMKATLDQLLTSMNSRAALRGELTTVNNSVTANYTPNEIAGFQNKIYALLSDPGFNLNKLNAMPEFQKLSEEDKKPVLEELARRLDSNEINKSIFLPGYIPASK